MRNAYMRIFSSVSWKYRGVELVGEDLGWLCVSTQQVRTVVRDTDCGIRSISADSSASYNLLDAVSLGLN